MQISTKSIYITEGAIFENTDLTHALAQFVPIRKHQDHGEIYKPEVFQIDHFMKDNLKHISHESLHDNLQKIWKRESHCITDCEIPMALIDKNPNYNVEARELAKKFNETAFLAKTPDIFKFYDMHKEHTVGQEFREMLPVILAVLLAVLWIAFVCITWKYYSL